MRKVVHIFICVFLWCFSFSISSYAQLNINFVAVNPSKEEKEIDIVFPLPRELEPDDILDAGPLELEFNVDKSSMNAHADIVFEPKESKTFKISVNDVWRINLEEIDQLKDQMDKSLAMIEGTENYDAAVFARDILFGKMDYILKQQEDFKGNIERRIELYRANITTLETIRNKIYNQDFLKFEAKSFKELYEEPKNITMVIEVKNPSDEKSLEVTHKHYLPREVRGDDIIDKQGLDLRFDEKKEKMYLETHEEFEPGEVKTYNIVLRDIWNFPDIRIQDLDDRAQIAMLELEGTNFQESAERLYGDIRSHLDDILASNALDTSIARHIGLFRLNTRRYEQAYQDFKRIEEMISIVRAKKLQEMESKRVKNVLERLKALRGLKQLSEALFKKKLSVNVTWKIIFGTLGFLALFTAFHFITWARRSKTMGEELGLKPGETVTVVPKPGEEGGEDDDEEE